MKSRTTFYVCYEFWAENSSDAEKSSRIIALEQTAELPLSAVPGHLKSYSGTAESPVQVSDERWSCRINYPAEIAGSDITQFLNVLFGNISLLPNFRVIDIDRAYLKRTLPGPSFGSAGIRKILSVVNRPLSCTALKPVGSSAEELAGLAYEFAAGGIDIIKDDHGLADQSTARFAARVSATVRAVQNGSRQSGKRTLYFPNITTSPDQVLNRYRSAHELGADGVLIAPQLTGPALLSTLSLSDIPLPLMAHPAFSGPYTIHSDSGFDPGIFYGLLWRALGADSIIYPNSGGRFSFSAETCQNINRNCRDEKDGIRAAFPVPAGGINREKIPEWIKLYGNETLFLVGGSLYQHPDGIRAATVEFQKQLADYE